MDVFGLSRKNYWTDFDEKTSSPGFTQTVYPFFRDKFSCRQSRGQKLVCIIGLICEHFSMLKLFCIIELIHTVWILQFSSFKLSIIGFGTDICRLWNLSFNKWAVHFLGRNLLSLTVLSITWLLSKTWIFRTWKYQNYFFCI